MVRILRSVVALGLRLILPRFRLAEEQIEIATEEAQAMARRLAREEGLFVGVSAGANVVAALSLARNLAAGSVVVTILCDGGERYMSERFWTE